RRVPQYPNRWRKRGETETPCAKPITGKTIAGESEQMAQSIEQKLSAMGVVLPTPSAPAASYVPTVATGSLLFTAGQLPLENGKLVATGLVGRDLDVSAGQAAARMCAINVLAQLKAAIGDLKKI